MYTSRQNDDIFEKVRKASAKCYKRKQRREVKKGGGVSIYNKGEHVLLRFAFSSRVPKRRYILRGKIIERKKGSNQYKVSNRSQDGNTEKCWADVSNISSLTKEKEKGRKIECWKYLLKNP